MNSERNLDKIITNSITIGDNEFEKYNKTQKKNSGKLALKAYNTALRAMCVIK